MEIRYGTLGLQHVACPIHGNRYYGTSKIDSPHSYCRALFRGLGAEAIEFERWKVSSIGATRKVVKLAGS